ncbi:hypothetical protein [Aminipila sp.]|uniref:hypothetical protein n=1 Tax=Aminipila sp. TaxID=2060095 RepID=UPI001D30427E|nr:hypothetical protein [Aminipila sp.]MBE6034180.1 hypothetical protein [Clostridiales bacterium]
MKRHFKIIFCLGIPMGILLAVIKNFLNIDDETFWNVYIIVGGIVIVGAVGINVLYQIRFVKRIKNMVNQAKEQNDFDGFNDEIEKLLKKYKARYNQLYLKFNLCYGLSKKKEYEKGLEVLKSIDYRSVKGMNKIIYHLDLAYFEFYLGNYEEAVRIIEENNKEFMKFKNNLHIGKNIAANTIYYHIAKKDYQKSQDLLREAEIKWTDKEMKEEWDMLNEIINKQTEGTLKDGGI